MYFERHDILAAYWLFCKRYPGYFSRRKQRQLERMGYVPPPTLLDGCFPSINARECYYAIKRKHRLICERADNAFRASRPRRPRKLRSVLNDHKPQLFAIG